MPALVGGAVGVLLILGDLSLPRSMVSATSRIRRSRLLSSRLLAAGIGEETIFRLFFISFWTWVVSRVICAGAAQTVIFWIVSVFSAMAFGVSHLPAFMYLENWKTIAECPADDG